MKLLQFAGYFLLYYKSYIFVHPFIIIYSTIYCIPYSFIQIILLYHVQIRLIVTIVANQSYSADDTLKEISARTIFDMKYHVD